MADHKTVLMIVTFLVSFALFYLALNKRISNIWAFMKVERTPDAYNDDESAVDKVIPLINQAKELLEIYDDGGNFPKSMYNNERFVSSIEEKLSENENFSVQCLFNKDESLLFTRRLASKSRVNIYTRFKGGESEVHYKIMDKGFKAYISVHDPKDKDRRAFKKIDCSSVPEKKFKYVAESIFGNIREDINNFKKKESQFEQ